MVETEVTEEDAAEILEAGLERRGGGRVRARKGVMGL